MILLFHILAALLIYLSYKSFRGGIDYLRYFRDEVSKPIASYTPYASVFVPCRGVDQGMLENLDALLSQDYPDYEVIFIVDEETDEAKVLIEAAWREARRQVKLVVAPKASDSSQKVENLREGVTYADERSEVFVFADSDARPSREWLRCLVAPLADPKVGAATGYRWFFSSRRAFAAEMRNMWNASIASALGPNRSTNFCWGGSTAIRRDIFERLEIRDRWCGTLSDDFTVTRAMNGAGLEIVFVPQALVASIEECGWRHLFEFTTRQMKITRVYMPKLWVMSFVGSGLFSVVMAAALLIIILSSRNDVNVLIALLTVVLVTFFSIAKSWLRLAAVRLVLKKYRGELRLQVLPQFALWTLTPAVFFYNCVAALLSRRVAWRGTTYEMISPTETRVLD